MQSMTIELAAIRLTDTILGDDEPDLEQTLRAIATNIGVQHIAYAPLRLQKSEDANLLDANSARIRPIGKCAISRNNTPKSIRSSLGEERRFFRSTGLNCPGMTQRLKHFLTTRLITMSATMGCRYRFEIARESVLWFPLQASIPSTIGPSISREI